ncbi:D-isomer specific 2-hydroxyacid dehydrogenase, catalytic domain,D-isomer specific 2-hydroxyacid [Cinara cedri]|uniref:Glyoxylate reductase/hydroxypyruvate reductase n=1 Tax=Cinara cedri TaxID=506608 RepID=A0A5E4NRQ6_9HEMI|nr:D-isomer specific 2-hydroxyacid dehydrogenase, catalytic domain,D-isomer specific 2-hydroxyacid [Cinara cedri]
MPKPQLLVSHNEIPQAVIDSLTEKFDVQIIDKPMKATTKQDLLENIAGKFGLFFSYTTVVDEDVINTAGPSLKVISTTSMGYESVDLDAVKKRGIVLGNTVLETAQIVAECTIGLLIATTRNFLNVNKQMKSGILPTATSFGMGLTNSVVGIIGCGNIGIAVAQMLWPAFKLSELLYTSRKPKSEMECLGGQFVSVDDLVRRSDFIIVTAVLVPETKFIINKDRLALMKPNAVVINVGRGLLIDQNALIDALQEHRIRGAGLDVMTPEPLPLDSPLMTMESVVLLPHIAGRNTFEASMRKAQLAADNILAVLNNQPVPCEVKL